MNNAGRVRGALLLMLVFLGLPALFWFAYAGPALGRIQASKARQAEAERRIQEILSVTPLTAEERTLLEDPEQPWRRRIPYLAGDAERIWHYHRVVTGLQRAWKARGVVTGGIRSTFEPIAASFSLPANLAEDAPFHPAPGTGPGRVHAWVLEATVQGSSDQLRPALEALPGCEPLLEPVGLRWQNSDDGYRQYLTLRNFILVP